MTMIIIGAPIALSCRMRRLARALCCAPAAADLLTLSEGGGVWWSRGEGEEGHEKEQEDEEEAHPDATAAPRDGICAAATAGGRGAPVPLGPHACSSSIDR